MGEDEAAAAERRGFPLGWKLEKRAPSTKAGNKRTVEHGDSGSQTALLGAPTPNILQAGVVHLAGILVQMKSFGLSLSELIWLQTQDCDHGLRSQGFILGVEGNLQLGRTCGAVDISPSESEFQCFLLPLRGVDVCRHTPTP